MTEQEKIRQSSACICVCMCCSSAESYITPPSVKFSLIKRIGIKPVQKIFLLLTLLFKDSSKVQWSPYGLSKTPTDSSGLWIL